MRTANQLSASINLYKNHHPRTTPMPIPLCRSSQTINRGSCERGCYRYSACHLRFLGSHCRPTSKCVAYRVRPTTTTFIITNYCSVLISALNKYTGLCTAWLASHEVVEAASPHCIVGCTVGSSFSCALATTTSLGRKSVGCCLIRHLESSALLQAAQLYDLPEHYTSREACDLHVGGFPYIHIFHHYLRV